MMPLYSNIGLKKMYCLSYFNSNGPNIILNFEKYKLNFYENRS